MRVSPHTHVESPLTGSTIKTMVAKAKELGRTHFAYTDHGHLSSALKTYEAVKKAGLKFIPGIEIYFKDTNCPYTLGTPAARAKYFTATIYCRDQASYQDLCRQVSRTDFPTMEINDETQQLWNWSDLELMVKSNTTIVLGGVHCMVGKCLLAGAPQAAMQVYERILQLFGQERVAAAILCEPWTKQFNTVVEIFYGDGTKDAILASDTVTTEKARRIRAIDLADRGGHYRMYSLTKGSTYYEINKAIDSVKVHKGFLPLPGGDATLKVNKLLQALSSRYGVKVLATDYAYYANKEDKIVQTMRLEGNNKLQPNLHMKSEEEVRHYLIFTMGFTPEMCQTIVENGSAWGAQFNDLTLKYDWRLAEVDGSAIQKIMEIVKVNGRMQWDNPKYVARLKEELDVIHRNGIFDLAPYFLPIRDVLNAYLEAGLLTGPGRGSAGGSLLCYLMSITQIDPFDFDLPFQRFFSMVRIKGRKLPDIDVDLEDRSFLVGDDGQSGYLYNRWGNKAAQVSTRTTIRLKSAIKDTNRYFMGKVEDEIETLTKGLPPPPQGISDMNFVFGFEDDEGNHVNGLIETSPELKKYSEDRPDEWAIVSKAMGLTRAYSSHASAFVISDVPIKDVVPTKDGNITQYEAKEVEAAGLIKYDFLVVKQLKDIRVAMDLIKKKANRTDLPVTHFPHQGTDTFIWKLANDSSVYRSIWSGQTETMFQINTPSMRPHVINMLPDSMMDLATLLALVRPGPLDFIDPNTGRNMVEEYMLRRQGQAAPDIQEMADLLPETFGILAFQEQLGKIARDLCGMSGEDAELLRENMAKKKMEALMKMKPTFMEGAIKKVSQEVADGIWERMVTFGRYGFSVIHAVEYAHITYACMFLKHYYPLEWWAAILTNATEQEITGKFWPFVKDIVAAPDINLSSDVMVVDYANEKLRSKFGVLRGMGEKTIDPIVANRPYADIQDYVNKKVAGSSLSHKLIHVGVLDSLFPPKISLRDKLQAYEDAMEVKSFQEKAAKATELKKKMRATQPKQGTVPSEYMNLHPMQDAAMKKAVLPSMPISTYNLGANFSKVLAPYVLKPMVLSARGYETILLNGEQLQRLDELEGSLVKEDIYVAATCYVVEAKEFSYSKNTKRALKMILDVDGYVSEKVLWPGYESGVLEYPASLKKGAIATFFLRKRVGKKDMAIMSITIETIDQKAEIKELEKKKLD